MISKEKQIEDHFINKLIDLKYTYRDDIRDRNALERNFRTKFEALNRVHLTDSEFDRLLEEIIDADVFASSKRLRGINTFMREDGTPLQYMLVNIKDWCKNDYEVINQLRINTNNSYHRYDVILLINGIPVIQVELKASDVSPRRAMQQIVDYKNDTGNGYTNTLLCFMQLFIVSNQANTYYFTNNNDQHFSFNTDEQFLPPVRSRWTPPRALPPKVSPPRRSRAAKTWAPSWRLPVPALTKLSRPPASWRIWATSPPSTRCTPGISPPSPPAAAWPCGSCPRACSARSKPSR